MPFSLQRKDRVFGVAAAADLAWEESNLLGEPDRRPAQRYRGGMMGNPFAYRCLAGSMLRSNPLHLSEPASLYRVAYRIGKLRRERGARNLLPFKLVGLPSAARSDESL